jgi:hypothetical protein
MPADQRPTNDDLELLKYYIGQLAARITALEVTAKQHDVNNHYIDSRFSQITRTQNAFQQDLRRLKSH